MYFPWLIPILLDIYNYPLNIANKNKLPFFKDSMQVTVDLVI